MFHPILQTKTRHEILIQLCQHYLPFWILPLLIQKKTLSEITNENRAIFSTLKPVPFEHGFSHVDNLHFAVEPLHVKYFHNDLKHLFATPLDWLLLMVSLSKDHNRQEEFQHVIDIFALVEATDIQYFQDTAECRKWHYSTHVHTLRPEHAFELAAYPSIQRFQVKRPTRSDPNRGRVTKFDELNESDNESSSTNVLVTSGVSPFHQDLVTCCKTLLKGSEESNQSMIASEIEPCSSLDFSKFLDPDLDREVLCDFQQCIEDETNNAKHRYFEIGYCSSAILPESQIIIKQAATLLFECFESGDHSKITELLQQGSTRVLFLHFNHLKSFGKKHESSQLDEEAGDKIHVH
eukprot:scaffold266050_cov52-Attheya_sp.AAC.1